MTPTPEQYTPEQHILDTAVTAVNRLTRQLRWFRYVLAAVIVLVAVLGGGGWKLHTDEQAAHQSQVDSCHAGNAYRASNEAGWDYFIALAVGPHPAPAVQSAAVKLRAKIHTLDLPRDCSTV